MKRNGRLSKKSKQEVCLLKGMRGRLFPGKRGSKAHVGNRGKVSTEKRDKGIH